MQIGVAIDDGGFGKVLNELLRRSMNLQPVFEDIGAAMQTSTEQRIENEGPAPDGTPWPELSAATKKKRGDDAKMLRDQGHLYQSLTYAASRLRVAWGTGLIYSQIQNLGGWAGRGRKVFIPARTFLGVSREDRKEIGEILAGYLEGAVR